MNKKIIWTATLFSSACTAPSESSEITFDIELISRSQGQGQIPSAIDPLNDPSGLGLDMRTRLEELPTHGRLSETPWSGSYWPENKGGIAYRWRTEESFDYVFATEEQVAAATPSQIANLSPAEKYDLLAGSTDWPLSARVLAGTSPNEASWTGYCHGWAPASLETDEPTPVTMVNDDGIEIRFGSSDIKALLTYFYAEVVSADYVGQDYSVERLGMGTACGSGEIWDPSCYDTNPAAFHIALTNLIGLRQMGFVMDVDPTYEKWNQPVYGYQSRALETLQPREGTNPEVDSIKIIQTQVSWGMEIEPQWEPLGSDAQVTKTQDYFYSLELSSDGEILGGQWVIQLRDGDFLTLDDAWSGLSVVDEDGDGAPDFDDDQISEILWQYYRFPDFIWVQNGLSLPESFESVASQYSLLATTASTRQELYDYMGLLPELIEAMDRSQ